MSWLRTPSLTGSLFVAGLGLVVPAFANNGGVNGYSGDPATQGGQTCNLCHNGGSVPSVSLSGPLNVDGGDTNTYTLTVSGGQEQACGLDVAVTAGELIPIDPGTWIFSDELTHLFPRTVDANDECVFAFDWTAPFGGGSITMYGAGTSVNLNALTEGDAASTDFFTIAVQPAPPGTIPPTADPGGPYAGVAGVAVQFDASASFDDDGMIAFYEWDFGDGNMGVGVMPTHVYAAPGDYDVSLAVTDDDEFTDVEDTVAHVAAEAPPIQAVKVLSSDLLENAVYVTAPRGDPRLFVVSQRKPTIRGRQASTS